MTLAWALILIACIWFSIVSPVFRKVFFVAIGITFFGCVLLLIYVSSQRTTTAPVQTATAAKQQPPPPPPRQFASADELVVSDLRVVPDFNEYGGYRYKTSGYQLTARVKNVSALPAENVSGELVALDCQSAGKCEVTGRERFYSRRFSIPAGETARLAAHVRLNEVAAARHARKWRIDFDEPAPR